MKNTKNIIALFIFAITLSFVTLLCFKKYHKNDNRQAIIIAQKNTFESSYYDPSQSIKTDKKHYEIKEIPERDQLNNNISNFHTSNNIGNNIISFNKSSKENDKEAIAEGIPNQVFHWREVTTYFDDVYSFREIQTLRNKYLANYSETSLLACNISNRKERDEIDIEIKSILSECIKKTEDLYEQSDNEKMRYEALLFIGELKFKSQEYAEVLSVCEQAIEGLQKERQIVQAHYYMMESNGILKKKDDAEYHRNIIFDTYPKQAKFIFYHQSSPTIESLMRNVSSCYEKVEKLHYMAKIAPTESSAQKLLEFRDRTLAIAERFYDIEKGGILDEIIDN